MFDRIIAHTGLTKTSRILDIGAGPGKGSLPFVEREISVISADPSPAMIEQGTKSYPILRYVCCGAEELPFRERSFDLVTSAQSFHWFDPPRALPELSRVLKPPGFLAVYWNTRDGDHEHIRLFDNLAAKFNPKHSRDYRAKDWGGVIEEGGVFKIAYHDKHSFTVPMTVEDWIGLARSVSYIRVIGDDLLPQFEREFREGLSAFPNVDCPYTTNIWLAQKTGNAGA